MITHSDPAAALGNLRQAYEHGLTQLSDVASPAGLARPIGVTRAGQLTKRAQFATAVSVQSSRQEALR